MKGSSTFKIVVTALFAALICVATMLVQIPIPATGGYANLGDGVILICAFLLNPLYVVIAAGLGSFLADVLAGYMSYALGTLVIKAGVALIVSVLVRKICRSTTFKKIIASLIISGVVAEAFMILGYFIYEATFLGLGLGAAGAIVGNIGQGVVGVIVACVVTPAMTRSREITDMLSKLN
ncbi:MAG: ECF transporter S component [Clostridia bacterium]|nr:ECF transporter S component [Clostridia bacterium]